jgi:hypothetical protein
MMSRVGTREVDQHLEAYAFMTSHLFTVSMRADEALELALDALRR